MFFKDVFALTCNAILATQGRWPRILPTTSLKHRIHEENERDAVHHDGTRCSLKLIGS